MATELRITLSELSERLGKRFDRQVPVWKLRRIVDSLESQNILDVQRIANYRTISDGDINTVAEHFVRMGWAEREAVSCK
jgi:hypothetical protein